MSAPSFRETGIALGYHANKPSFNKECVTCGGVFQTKQPKRGKFCSRRCDSTFRQKEAAVMITKIKLEKGCIDCGYKGHPSALDFDHIFPRTKGKSRINSKKRRQVSHSPTIKHAIEEMHFCEIRCANCHRIKTWYERDKTRPRALKEWYPSGSPIIQGGSQF